MISTIIFFVLPMGLILSLYFLIGIKLRQSSRSMGNSTVSTVASINSARLIKKPDLLPSPMTHSPSDSMCPSPKIVKAPHQNENSSSNYNSNSGESNSRHHLHQKGSRLVDGVNYYRAHAASRRAVVKMLGMYVYELVNRCISFTITLFHTDDNCLSFSLLLSLIFLSLTCETNKNARQHICRRRKHVTRCRTETAESTTLTFFYLFSRTTYSRFLSSLLLLLVLFLVPHIFLLIAILASFACFTDTTSRKQCTLFTIQLCEAIFSHFFSLPLFFAPSLSLHPLSAVG